MKGWSALALAAVGVVTGTAGAAGSSILKAFEERLDWLSKVEARSAAVGRGGDLAAAGGA